MRVGAAAQKVNSALAEERLPWGTAARCEAGNVYRAGMRDDVGEEERPPKRDEATHEPADAVSMR